MKAHCRFLAALPIMALLVLGADARAQLPDHFTCYGTRPTAGTARFAGVAVVTVVDRFHASTVDVRRPEFLCAPTNKNDEDPSAPGHPDHLLDYKSHPTTPFTTTATETVIDQFGTHALALKKARALLVPAAKSLSVPPPTPATPAVDHFQCYKAKSATALRFMPVTGVTLADQFGNLTVTVKKVRRLCVPANKNDEEPGAENHSHDLLCYQITETSEPRFARQSPIYVADQFGALTLDAVKPRELCVPAVRPGAVLTPTPVCTGCQSQTPTTTVTPTATPTETPTPLQTDTPSETETPYAMPTPTESETPTATPTPACGNTVCDADETCATCCTDCGPCPPTCSDGVCHVGETCAADCAASADPQFPLVLGDCLFDEFRSSGSCSDLPQLVLQPDGSDSAWTTLGSGAASASDLIQFLPTTCCAGGQCGGGLSPPHLQTGGIINVINGASSTTLNIIADCFNDGLRTWVVPLASCGSHSSGSTPVTGFTTMVIAAVHTLGSQKGIDFHAICSTCGDGGCTEMEDCSTCAADCGGCPLTCDALPTVP
jgi:hypothetical protein